MTPASEQSLPERLREVAKHLAYFPPAEKVVFDISDEIERQQAEPDDLEGIVSLDEETGFWLCDVADIVSSGLTPLEAFHNAGICAAAKIQSLESELERLRGRVETLKKESQERSDKIREIVPNYMSYWPPLNAVAHMAAELQRYGNPWTVEILNQESNNWESFAHDAPLTLANAEARAKEHQTENPDAKFRVTPWLNLDQRQVVERLRGKREQPLSQFEKESIEEYQQFLKMRRSLENVAMFARREQHRSKGAAPGWDTIIRFCEEAGVKANILRDAVGGEREQDTARLDWMQAKFRSLDCINTQTWHAHTGFDAYPDASTVRGALDTAMQYDAARDAAREPAKELDAS